MLPRIVIDRRCFILTLALGRQLRGNASDFWNQKPESEWSPEEINQLLTSSPWAKSVRVAISILHKEKESAGTPSDVAPAAQRCSEAVGGPVELNRGDRSTCGLGQMKRVASSEIVTHGFTANIRWETAMPVEQVSHSLLSGRFTNRYVLSVRGLPVGDGVSTKGELFAGDAAIETIRRASTLSVQNWMRRKPPVAAQTAQIAGSALLLGFSRGALHLAVGDDEVEFKTVIKAASVAATFKLHPMIFRGALAL